MVMGGQDFVDFLGWSASSVNHQASDWSHPSPDGVGS